MKQLHSTASPFSVHTIDKIIDDRNRRKSHSIWSHSHQSKFWWWWFFFYQNQLIKTHCQCQRKLQHDSNYTSKCIRFESIFICRINNTYIVHIYIICCVFVVYLALFLCSEHTDDEIGVQRCRPHSPSFVFILLSLSSMFKSQKSNNASNVLV